ncbi:MAG: putative hydrolase [Chlamydiae bacterium]|nr:putative hydrolase [Chlamydiota bacterium]
MELSAFDLDDTLIRGNCSAGFCRYLHKQKVLPASVIWLSLFYSIRHRFFGMSLTELHESVFEKVLRGKPLEMLEKYVDTFVKDYVNGSLYMPAFARLKKAQQLGHYTMILSNSPSFLVQRFAKALGVNAYYATEYTLDEQNRFMKIRRILEGKDKAEQIKKIAKKLGVFWEKIHAYSDSVLDLEFLKVAGNPTAVNPDRKLREISLQNQWSII